VRRDISEFLTSNLEDSMSDKQRMKRWSRWAVCLLALPLAVGCTHARQRYTLERVVAGSAFHGVHGLAFDREDRLYAGSVVGQSIYTVDTQSGQVRTEVGAPEGMADDLDFGPEGTLAWTGFLQGVVRARGADGSIRELATGLPGINSIAFNASGRLFATQVFLGDALYELDPAGSRPARKILEGMGGLNGFDFGPDGWLYGPLWFKGTVAKVNVDTGELVQVASGFGIPAAANFDSRGNLWVVDTARGEVVKVDVATGGKQVVARVRTSIDNLALDSRDRLFISNMADNGVYEIDTTTGQARTVVEGRLAMPGGLALVEEGGREVLHVADLFAYRTVQPASGEVRDVARMQADVLEYPFSARAGRNHVLLSSWFSGSVQKVERSTGRSVAMLHGFQAPHDALELEDGSLLVAELGTGRLLRVSGEQGQERTVVAEGLGAPVGLAMAGEGSVYVTEVAAGRLSQVDLATGERRTVAEGLSGPEGLDVGVGGEVIVAEVGRRRLVAVDPRSGQVRVLAEELPVGLPGFAGAPPSYVPTGVAVSRQGSIYFTSDVENALYRLRPE
jgi:sugar lactone lactonase YvrE